MPGAGNAHVNSATSPAIRSRAASSICRHSVEAPAVLNRVSEVRVLPRTSSMQIETLAADVKTSQFPDWPAAAEEAARH